MSAVADQALPRLRAATNADREAIGALLAAVLAEHGVARIAARDADLDDIEAGYQARGGCFDVLCDADGTVQGCVGLWPIDGRRAELRKMYLAPALRGRGLGRALLEHALAVARRAGFARIELETASALGRAIALYRAYGFVPQPHTPAPGSPCEQAFALDLERRRPT